MPSLRIYRPLSPSPPSSPADPPRSPSARSGTIPHLPPEILDIILEQLEITEDVNYSGLPYRHLYNSKDLANTCLVSQTFLSLARPRLYRSIRLGSRICGQIYTSSIRNRVDLAATAPCPQQFVLCRYHDCDGGRVPRDYPVTLDDQSFITTLLTPHIYPLVQTLLISISITRAATQQDFDSMFDFLRTNFPHVTELRFVRQTFDIHMDEHDIGETALITKGLLEMSPRWSLIRLAFDNVDFSHVSALTRRANSQFVPMLLGMDKLTHLELGMEEESFTEGILKLPTPPPTIGLLTSLVVTNNSNESSSRGMADVNDLLGLVPGLRILKIDTSQPYTLKTCVGKLTRLQELWWDIAMDEEEGRGEDLWRDIAESFQQLPRGLRLFSMSISLPCDNNDDSEHKLDEMVGISLDMLLSLPVALEFLSLPSCLPTVLPQYLSSGHCPALRLMSVSFEHNLEGTGKWFWQEEHWDALREACLSEGLEFDKDEVNHGGQKAATSIRRREI
ncbi:hypothetical protein T439DRAFT_323195 [Meredithblackwellia eburnea MCA 4105]